MCTYTRTCRLGRGDIDPWTGRGYICIRDGERARGRDVCGIVFGSCMHCTVAVRTPAIVGRTSTYRERSTVGWDGRMCAVTDCRHGDLGFLFLFLFLSLSLFRFLSFCSPSRM